MSSAKGSSLTQLLIEFYEKFSSWEHDIAKESELTTTQLHAVELLGNNNALKMKELAHKMGITTGTLTIMVDRLEQKGVLKRVPHQSDRRVYLLMLTDYGKKEYQKHYKLHDKFTSEIIENLSSEELEHYITLMSKIVQSM